MNRMWFLTALLLASAAHGASPYDGRWGSPEMALFEISGTSIRQLYEAPADLSVCVPTYDTVTEVDGALEATFRYVCDDGSSGGIGVTTFILDGETLTEMTCDGMEGQSREQMRCFDPSVMTRLP